MLIRTPWKRTILVCVYGQYKTGWKETEHRPNVENTHERRWFGRTDIIPWPRWFGLHAKMISNKQRYCWQLQEHVRIQNLCWSYRKALLFGENSDANISSRSCDIEGHAKKCVERYGELANKTTQQVYKVATPCIGDHQFKEEEMGSVGEWSKVCSQIVVKCLYLARIGRPDILWSVNKLARAIT